MSNLNQKRNKIEMGIDFLHTFVLMRRTVLVFFALLALPVLGQYVRIGAGSYLGTAGGPFASSTQTNWVTRWAYIFPKSVLGNLKHGDTITSFEFNRAAGPALNSSTNLLIFVNNTSKSDYGISKLYWPGVTSSAVRVYDQNPSLEISTSEGFQKIPFYNKVYVFDTTKGENLEVMVEYKQTAAQTGPAYWYFENGGTVAGYGQYQVKYITGATANDSLANSSDYHPDIIINYPRYDQDIAMIKVYSLGKLPVPLGNPDSVKALVRNVGKKDAMGVKAATFMIGANKNQKDSTTFDINVGQQKFINLPSLKPAKKGVDSLYVAIFGDNNSINDTGFSIRLANENVYSYRDISKSPDPGGIGFNGSTGDFVARFFSNKAKAINQVSVNFSITGRPFKVGIWGTNGNKPGPGKLIYLSDSLQSVGGVYILDLKKPVSVNGSFFVGVRQLNTSNVAFGYQTEEPVRPNTFFYTAPAGDTNWFDFYPDAPFKFLIEPRLQGDTDLTVLSADYPKDTLDKYKIDTLAPKATIANIGVKDIKDSFSVTCVIQVFGRQVYKAVIKDTLSAGLKRQYTFPKTFFPQDFGEHQMYVYTSLGPDQIRDNDTALRKFYVGVSKDVIVQTVYEPSQGTIYEYLRDTFQPVATIQNPGYDNSVSFIARCRILKGNTVVYNRTQTLNLPRFQSRILAWPTYQCLDTGKLNVVFTVEMPNDQNRKNDTIKRQIFVFKSFDIGIDSVAVPDKFGFYTAGKAIKPLFRAYNDGVLNAFDVRADYVIKSVYTNKVFIDSVVFNVPSKSSNWVLFPRNFIPPVRGIYTIVIKTKFKGDLIQSNDSMKFDFNVGYPYDYTSVKINYPIQKDTLDVGGGPFQPSLKLKNNGFIKNADLCPVVFQIWHNKTRVYQDIKSLTLDTSQTFDQVFNNNFNPINGGKYDVIAYTNYVSEVNKKNDTARSSFWVNIGKNAYILSIDTPLVGINYHARKSIIPVSATITNEGKLKMGKVKIIGEIFKDKKSYYYDVLNDSLEGKEVKKIYFSKTFLPPDSGNYTLMVYTSSLEDQNIFDDTLRSVITIVKEKDARPVNFVEPQAIKNYIDKEGNISPALSIANIGMGDTMAMTGNAYLYFMNQAGSQIFADTLLFSNLLSTKIDTLYSAKKWNVLNAGTYSTMAIVKATGDLFPENDTLKSDFTVLVNGIKTQVTEDITVFPNPTDGMLHILVDGKLLSVKILDLTGRQMLQTSNTDIDISHLSASTYLLQIRTNTASFSGKIMKE